MRILIHILTSIVLSFLLFPLFDYNALWIIFGGVLIDFDHYLYYVFKFKSLNLKKAYTYHAQIDERKIKVHDILHAFHTMEVFALIILIIILSYLYKINLVFYTFLPILIGMVLHMILDFINIYRHNKTDPGAFKDRAISLFGWLKRRNLF